MSQYTALSGPTAISASSTKTLLSITAPTRGLKVKEVTISFDGTDAAKTPVQVEFTKTSSAGTGTSTTPADDQATGLASDTTALKTLTVEPSSPVVHRQWYVTPAGGLWAVQWPLGDEPSLFSSEHFAIRVITASGVACNAMASITFVE